MKVLVIGSGGREHAICHALELDSTVSQIFICPGNGAQNSPKMTKLDLKVSAPFTDLIQFALENKIGLVVPGPEVPLVEGISDAFKNGPSKAAAQLEGSKSYSKTFMKKHGIPTAAFETFTDFKLAKAYLDTREPLSVVIKASGLAAGKGVILPETKTEATEALENIMLKHEFGSAGDNVVIEERLTGEEVSVLAFVDGYTVVTMPAAQDHKRALNGDKGLNTGGMGCYAPAPIYTAELQALVKRTIIQPTIDAMRREGHPFVGILYTGIMLTPNGPKVLEYNVRFGDPETQAILPLLKEDCSFLQIMLAASTGCLDSVPVDWKSSYACTVVVASGGYPGAYKTGLPINFSACMPSNCFTFHAGTTNSSEGLITSGGRVLSVTAVSPTLHEAIKSANAAVLTIKFEGAHFRTDIGYKATAYLEALKTTKLTYADAGVSIDAGNELVEQIKPFVKATRRPGADAEIGGFGGVFDLKAAGYSDPILISGTDGVGTKLTIAQAIGKHDTIGIDLVAMSVNDVLVQGAEPLYFLDYFASSKLDISVAADVVKGIAQGCLESGCALIGGETAEMPGIYKPGEYDLAGFVVGAVERDSILPKSDDCFKSGDVLLGLASSGVHSNGYSLVRHIVKLSGLEYSDPCAWSTSKTLGEALLTPTRLYVKPLLPVIKAGLVKSMVHITGGGFLDNIPRSVPKNFACVVKAGSWPFLPIFKWLKSVGNVENEEIARTFNCGIGMVLVVDAEKVEAVRAILKENGEPVYQIGHLVDVAETEGKLVRMDDMELKW